MIWLLVPLGLLLCAGLWQLLMEQDEPARITQADLDAESNKARVDDRRMRYSMRMHRDRDYQEWRIKFREAEHIRAISRFRRFFEGSVG